MSVKKKYLEVFSHDKNRKMGDFQVILLETSMNNSDRVYCNLTKVFHVAIFSSSRIQRLTYFRMCLAGKHLKKKSCSPKFTVLYKSTK